MSKHTPGPWSANFASLNGKVYHWHVTDLKNGTMNAVAMADEEQGNPRTASELEANAHLIAAAPDLLEALEGLLLHGTRSPYEAWVKAAEAITKAKGSQHRCTTQHE